MLSRFAFDLFKINNTEGCLLNDFPPSHPAKYISVIFNNISLSLSPALQLGDAAVRNSPFLQRRAPEVTSINSRESLASGTEVRGFPYGPANLLLWPFGSRSSLPPTLRY